MSLWSRLKGATSGSQTPTPPEADLFARCAELLQAGHSVEAETLAERAVRGAPAGSHQRADALNTLGSVRLARGRIASALAALCEACEGPLPADPEERKERQRADLLDEAEAAFRRGLALREEHYGREHAGYAFGLEPLAN